LSAAAVVEEPFAGDVEAAATSADVEEEEGEEAGPRHVQTWESRSRAHRSSKQRPPRSHPPGCHDVEKAGNAVVSTAPYEVDAGV
jgi:hypothetical protein